MGESGGAEDRQACITREIEISPSSLPPLCLTAPLSTKNGARYEVVTGKTSHLRRAWACRAIILPLFGDYAPFNSFFKSG